LALRHVAITLTTPKALTMPKVLDIYQIIIKAAWCSAQAGCFIGALVVF
jgi:hypothetical protein